MGKDITATRSTGEEFGLNDPPHPDTLRATPDGAEPAFVWIKYAVESAPVDGLDYRSDEPLTEPVAPAAGVVRDDALRQLIRATTLQTLGERAVFLLPAASEQGVAQRPSSAAGPYSTANLPPGVSERRFNAITRQGLVRFAVVGGRKMVRAADWDAYLASCAGQQGVLPQDASDDDLLGSNGGRRRPRK